MMKSLAAIGMTLSAFALIAAEIPADPPPGPVKLTGGVVSFGERVEILSDPEDLNFVSALRSSDGVIYLNHSIGLHGVRERGGTMLSRDNGQSWIKPDHSIPGVGSFERKDGILCRIDGWDPNMTREHTLKMMIWNQARDRVEREVKIPVVLPFEAGFLRHGQVTRLSDGRLVTAVYGREKGKTKFTAYVIASEDDGNSWQYLSTVFPAEIPYGTKEGPCEMNVVELKNGDLLAIARTGDIEHGRENQPLIQARSTDGGKSWSKAEVIDEFGVSPKATTLADGTLVIVSGRPGVYLLVDFSGTGRKYEKVWIFKAPNKYQCSAYCAIPRIADDTLLLCYDISSFSNHNPQRQTNHIFALPVTFSRK